MSVRVAGLRAGLFLASMFGLGFGFAATPVLAGERAVKPEAPKVGPVTGRPLPRFASLKSRSVNMRVGPGTRYGIAWRYRRPGLPVSIVGEHGNWLQIRDADGAEGWVLHSLLVGRRTALVAPWSAAKGGGVADGIANLISTALPAKSDAPLLDAHAGPSRDEPVRARLQAGLVVKLKRCDTRWCAVEAQGRDVWLPQSALWGIGRDERIGG